MEGLTLEQLGRKTKSHLCLFCYKNARGFSCTDDSSKSNENAKSWKYFLKIIQRMKGHTANEKSDLFGDIGCCEDCLVIIKEFTAFYHKVKCLELQLLWKLDKLMKIMKLATRVPSRVNQIKQSFTELYHDSELAENKMQNFKSSRNKLMKTCAWKLFNSQPRVILTRLPDSNQIGDFNFSAKTEQTITLLPQQPEAFLGWTMSFAAVAMLASLSHGMGEEHLKILNTHNTQYHQICDDEDDLTVGTENIMENVSFNDVEDGHTLISSKEPNPELQSLPNFIAKTELITDQPNDEDTSSFCNIPSPQSCSNYSDSSHSEDMMLDVSDQEDEEESHTEQKPAVSEEEADNKPLLQEPAWVVCTICQREFESDKYLQKHLQTVHTVYTLSPHICSICNLTYPKIGLLRHHYKKSKSHHILWNIARKKQLSNAASSSRDADEGTDEVVSSTNSKELQNSSNITTITTDSTKQRMDEESSSFCNVPSPQTSSYYSESSHSDEDDDESHTEQKSEKTDTKSQLQNPAAPQYTCRICNLTYAYNSLLQRHYKRSKSHQVLWKRAQKQLSYVQSEPSTKFPQNENLKEKNYIHSNKIDENVPDDVQPGILESISQKIDHGKQATQLKDTNTVQKTYNLRKRKAANFREMDDQEGSERDTRSDSEYEPDEEEMQVAEENEQIFKRVKHNGGDSEVIREKCKICKQNIITQSMALHVKENHDLKSFDPSKIRKCHFKDCTAYFKTSRQCRRHKLSVHGIQSRLKWEGTIQCKYCSKTFYKKDALDYHIRKWHANRLVCSVSKCSKRFNTLTLLKQHETLHGSWKCQFCDVIKDYVPDLACHEVQHAYREKPNAKIFSCARCTQDFKQKLAYEQHFIRHHLNSIRVPATGSPFRTPKSWKCHLEPCIEQTFSVFEKYQEHQKLHAPGCYTCSFCNDIQDNMIKLSMHELEVHGHQNETKKNFACPRCPSETRNVHNYQRHFAQVHLEDPTIGDSEGRQKDNCTICKQTVPINEMKVHHKECHDLEGFDPRKVYKCNVKGCLGYFKKQEQVFVHKRYVHKYKGIPNEVPELTEEERKEKEAIVATPDGKRLFECKICKKRFPNHFSFRLHVSKRCCKESSLHKCSACNCKKTFVTKQKLRQHQRLHGNWKCQFCDVTKDYIPDLACHEAVHACRENPNNALFSCARCTQDFTEKLAYERHFVRYHLSLTCFTATDSPVRTSRIWRCKLEPCKTLPKFSTFERYQEHQTLHAPGHYTCNFCNDIHDNMIKLSMHELEVHGQHEYTKNVSCPRCPWEARYVSIYQRHFAQVHLQGDDSSIGKSGGYKQVKCLICNQTMAKMQLKLHQKACHDLEGFDPQKVLKCDIQGCSAYFKKKQQVLVHKQNVHQYKSAKQIAAELTEEERKEKEAIVETTDGKRLFECKVCKKRFHQHFRFRLHVSKVHRENPLLHKCPVSECKLKFTTAQLLEQHQKLHGNWKCQFCDETKNYAPDLAFHEVQHAYRTTRDKDGTKLWCCARCNQNNKSKGRYKKHFLTHHLKLLNTSPCCPICGADGLTNTTAHLKAHQKAFHDVDGMAPENIARCDLCPAYFKTNIQLEQHKFIQHWERKCPACEYGKQGLPRLSLLRCHIQWHHAHLMPHWKFACSNRRCRQRYATQQQLANHESRCEYGNQVQEFPCPTCGKAYKRKLRLSLHMKNAHGEKCQQCQKCGKAFRTKAALQNHLEFHKSPDQWKFACDECNRRFAHKGILNQHKNTHTQEKPYVCEYCGEKYAHKHNWRNHVKTKHPNEADNQS